MKPKREPTFEERMFRFGFDAYFNGWIRDSLGFSRNPEVRKHQVRGWDAAKKISRQADRLAREYGEKHGGRP